MGEYTKEDNTFYTNIQKIKDKNNSNTAFSAVKVENTCVIGTQNGTVDDCKKTCDNNFSCSGFSFFEGSDTEKAGCVFVDNTCIKKETNDNFDFYKKHAFFAIDNIYYFYGSGISFVSFCSCCCCIMIILLIFMMKK